MGWLTIRDIPMSLGFLTCTIVLEILCLGSKQPTKLIVALLDKVYKSGILRSNKSLEGSLFLLNRPKGVLDIRIVSRGLLRGRTRSWLTSIRGWVMGDRPNILITG